MSLMPDESNMEDVAEFLTKMGIIDPENQYLLGMLVGNILCGVAAACQRNDTPEATKYELYSCIICRLIPITSRGEEGTK